MEEKNKKLNLTKVFQLISIIIGIICVIYIVIWAIENNTNNNITKEVNKYVKKTNNTETNINNSNNYDIDFQSLISKNAETIGWIKVNETNINYPVVKATNNEYYLTHDFNKNYNKAGWIFADCNCSSDLSDKNMIIYGHNRKDGSMFANLKNLLKSEWYKKEENKYISYNSINIGRMYQIFSVYEIDTEEYYLKNQFENDDEYIKFINTLKERSIIDFGTQINKSNNIITLSTCSDDNSKRIVIHAKF